MCDESELNGQRDKTGQSELNERRDKTCTFGFGNSSSDLPAGGLQIFLNLFSRPSLFSMKTPIPKTWSHYGQPLK